MKANWTNTVSKPMFAASDEKIVEPLIGPLFEDAIEYDRLLSENDSQFARRGYLRAGFALIEGQLYFLKECLRDRILGDFHRTQSLDITAFNLLDDITYSIGGNGILHETQQRHSFQNLCAFVFRTACSLGNGDADKLFSDSGWDQLRKAIKVRHRLTHPKDAAALAVSDDEIFHFRNGYVWFWNSMVTSVGSISPAD